MRSSYIQNNYGEVFHAIISAFVPTLCVELGVLDGYSTLHIAKGLRDLNRSDTVLWSYDLFDSYPYKHGEMGDVRAMLEKEGVSDLVQLVKQDAYEAHNNFNDASVHMLHVDISNTGDTIDKIMERWDNKIVHHGIIIFEGGTEERDEVEWMKKYSARPIKPALEQNKIIEEHYVFATYLKFPGLTMLLKKR